MEKQFLFDWFAGVVPESTGFNVAKDQPLGVLSDEGKIAAVVVFSDYQPAYSTIQSHVASDNPLWPRGTVIRDILAYPFLVLGLFKVWAAFPSDNKGTGSLTKKMGFTQEAILGHHYGKGRNAVIMRLYKPTYLQIYWPKETPRREAAA